MDLILDQKSIVILHLSPVQKHETPNLLTSITMLLTHVYKEF